MDSRYRQSSLNFLALAHSVFGRHFQIRRTMRLMTNGSCGDTEGPSLFLSRNDCFVVLGI